MQMTASDLSQRLFQPVSNASLIAFRIMFGLTMMVEVYRYWSKGWINGHFIEPAFHFKYYGFEWVQALGGNGMYWVWALIGLSSFMIMVGLMYRLATLLFFVSFSYIFLIDQARYLNHFYFVILLAGLLCITPLNKRASIDAWLKPELSSKQAPTWCLWIFVAQMEIMYLYAGIVKINPDWLQLQPLTMWLGSRDDLALIGPLMNEAWVIAAASYGSIILHVLGAPLLFFKQTRIYVFIAYCGFHLMNHIMFQIGIFPWLTLAGTLLFFAADWPIRMEQKLQQAFARFTAWRQPMALRKQWLTLAKTIPMNGEAVAGISSDQRGDSTLSNGQRALIVFLLLWLAYQVLMPLRHLLYPGNPSWTEEGHRFAWQMKLRSKRGDTTFHLLDRENGRYWRADQKLDLNRKQRRVMACRPDMILQYAHFLADRYETIRGHRPEVRVTALCSLNGRAKQNLIDPDRNLAEVPRTLKHADWILPLTTPLKADKS